jgi:hypothetical protein
MFAFFLSVVGHSRSRSLQIAIKLFGSFHLSVGLVGQEITGREELRLVRDGSRSGDPSLLVANSSINCTHSIITFKNTLQFLFIHYGDI